jgi:hypothetical protein
MLTALFIVMPCSLVDEMGTVCYLYGTTPHKTTGTLFYVTTLITDLQEDYFMASHLVYVFIAC